MTDDVGDAGDEARAHATAVEELAAVRREWYDALGEPVDPPAPNPRLPLDARAGRPRLGTVLLWCGYAAGMLHLAALSAGPDDHALPGIATLLYVLGFLALPVAVWRVRRAARAVQLPRQVGRPWLDLLEGLRLGAVEPGNPAWGVALAHVGEVRRLLGRVARRWDQRRSLAPDLVETVQAAGALTWATGEEWRRRGPDDRGDRSALDRFPVSTGPAIAAASAASDAASDAGTAALGAGTYDLDFDAYARRRAAMYDRAGGDVVRAPDPARPVPVGPAALRRLRQRAALGLVVVLGGVVGAVAALGAGALWWSVLLAAPAYVVWWRARDLAWRDLDPGTVRMSAGPAMAWRDYLDALDHVDSGAASVTTVEAVRGHEPRVRALVAELVAGTAAVERPVLEAELHRIASEAWTLVGQERAEERLLDELGGGPDAAG